MANGKIKVSLVSGADRTRTIPEALALISDQVQIPDRPVLIKPNFVSTLNQLSATPVDAVRSTLTFLKDKGGANLPAWLDPENDLAIGYGGGVLPTTVLYDAQGKEVWRYVGGNEWDSKEAQALLAEAP